MEKETKQLINIIRLIRTQNVGPITFFKLLEKFKDEENALHHVNLMAKKNGKDIKIYSIEEAKEEIAIANQKNIHIVSYLSEYYPPLLKNIEDKPPVLFVKGNLSLLKKSSIGIVGSRDCTLNGKLIAKKFAQELGNNGFLVVSGLARGIDTSAHQGSIEKGTLAFLGGGVDVVYPTENKDLYEEIATKGALVSEFKIGTPPIASNFPKRNRLISGMSRGILVIEASKNSGSIITANMALEQGRDVFAIPGSPLDRQSSGANTLIQNGAILVQNVEDIINSLNTYTLKESANKFKNTQLNFENISQIDDNKLESAKSYLLQILSSTPISVDIILRETDFNFDVIQNAILELELIGKVIRLPNNSISLIVDI